MLKTVYFDGWISYWYDIDINDIYLISYHIVSVEKKSISPITKHNLQSRVVKTVGVTGKIRKPR